MSLVSPDQTASRKPSTSPVIAGLTVVATQTCFRKRSCSTSRCPKDVYTPTIWLSQTTRTHALFSNNSARTGQGECSLEAVTSQQAEDTLMLGVRILWMAAGLGDQTKKAEKWSVQVFVSLVRQGRRRPPAPIHGLGQFDKSHPSLMHSAATPTTQPCRRRGCLGRIDRHTWQCVLWGIARILPLFGFDFFRSGCSFFPLFMSGILPNSDELAEQTFPRHYVCLSVVPSGAVCAQDQDGWDYFNTLSRAERQKIELRPSPLEISYVVGFSSQKKSPIKIPSTSSCATAGRDGGKALFHAQT